MRIRVRGGAGTLVGRWWNRGRVVGDAWWVAGGLCVRRIESLLGPQGPQQFTSVVVFLFCRTWPHHPHGHHTPRECHDVVRPSSGRQRHRHRRRRRHGPHRHCRRRRRRPRFGRSSFSFGKHRNAPNLQNCQNVGNLWSPVIF